MGTYPAPHHADDTPGENVVLDRSLRRVLREDEYATPDVARRQLIREVVDLLHARHALRAHPTREDQTVVLNGNRKKVKTVTADIAAEAEAAYRREIEAKDPAAVPVENGGDGKRVDPFALCREVGLPPTIAEHGSGEVFMTADVAQAILDRNKDNRPIRWDAVTRFASLMEEGRWKLTTDAIGIDAHGRVVNGQHRLEALTRTCEPQPFLVKVDVDPDAFAVIDSGRPRTPADALHIAGYTHRFPRAAVIRLVAQAERGYLWMRWRKVEADEVLERAAQMEPRLTACIQEGTSYNVRSKRLITGSTAAFLLWAYDAEHGEAIREYLEQIAKGFGIEEGRPAGTVRNALIANLQAYPKMPGVAVLALLVRGAEAHVAGQPMPFARVQGSRAWPSLSVMGWPPQVVPAVGRKKKPASTPSEAGQGRPSLGSAPSTDDPSLGPFAQGALVRIVSGAFDGFTGTVAGPAAAEGRVVIVADIADERVPLTLSYDEVALPPEDLPDEASAAR